MISYLSGKAILVRPMFVILDVSGVGYKVFILPKVEFKENEKYELFIHHHIKEDTSDLYGFEKFEELELFEKLLSVNGVGPKAAMTVMGLAPTGKIIEAIVSEDATFFQSAPGIGKKVAVKIIVDLKSKVSGIELSGVISSGRISEEAIEGLAMLGYKRSEIEKIILKMPRSISTPEEQIKWVLKNSAKR